MISRCFPSSSFGNTNITSSEEYQVAVWTFTTLFEGRQGSQEWVFFFFPIHVAEDFFETITTYGNTNLNSTEEYQVTLLTLFPKGAKEINRIFKSNILQGHGPEASSDCHYPWEYDHNLYERISNDTRFSQLRFPSSSRCKGLFRLYQGA